MTSSKLSEICQLKSVVCLQFADVISETGFHRAQIVQVLPPSVVTSLHGTLDALVERCGYEREAYSSALVERQVLCRHLGSLVWVARDDRTVMRQIRSTIHAVVVKGLGEHCRG